jgi:histidine triad (HIT) family protein
MSGMQESCIFCLIGAGKVPAHRICENERIVAFLDLHPIRPGHVQIIPKAHYARFDDLPEDLLTEIALTGRRIARALKSIWQVERAGFLFTGADIAHAHAHVLPLHRRDDITSRRYIVEETVTYRLPDTPPAEELQQIADSIRQRLAAGA